MSDLRRSIYWYGDGRFILKKFKNFEESLKILCLKGWTILSVRSDPSYVYLSSMAIQDILRKQKR